MEQNLDISESYKTNKTVVFRRLAHSGGRGQRKDALSRARAGAVLCLCLKIERSEDNSSVEKTTIDVAIIASKKQVSKEAVDRNRAKRRVRSAIQQLPKETFADILSKQKIQHVDCLFVCSRDCLSISFVNLLRDLSKSLEKALTSGHAVRKHNVD
ncbi:MAG: Ribonuclease [Pseudomonadota bacterium]